MNTPEIQHDITVLKDFLLGDNGTYQTKKIVYKWIAARCPQLMEYFNNHYDAEDFRGFIYCILKDSDMVPVIPCCPVCGKKLKLYDFVKGFHKTCCRACADALYRKNKAAHQRISETKKEQRLKADWLYAYDFETIPNNTIFKNYCKHGDVKISDAVMYTVHEIGESTFCYECNKELFETYTPDDKEIADTVSWFQEYYKLNSHSLNYKFWIRYYPKKFKCLVTKFESVTGKSFDESMLQELHYICQSGMEELPKCVVCGQPVTKFHASVTSYATRCDEHLKTVNNMSAQESELRDFIKGLCLHYNIVYNERSVLNGQEIDIYIPELKIGFEFNGVYWHSDKFLPHEYHMKKKQLAANKGIKLYFIWSDVWLDKTAIVKNIIKSKLGLNVKTIKPRDIRVVQEIPKSDAIHFFNANHIKGYMKAGLHLGLYANGVLAYCISFQKHVTGYEIIQYAALPDYQIYSGIHILYGYFTEYYSDNKHDMVTCNVPADLSSGTLMKSLWLSYIGSYEEIYQVNNNKRVKLIGNKADTKCYTSGLLHFSSL